MCSPVEILAGNDTDSVYTIVRVSVEFWEFKLCLVFGNKKNGGQTVLGLCSDIIYART